MRRRLGFAVVIAIAAGAGAYLCGVGPQWSLVIGVLAPAVPGFLLGALRGARTASPREDVSAEMSGTDFEDHIARVIKSAGVPVQMTKASGDFGVDLVVGRRPNRLAVQCKRQSRPVGSPAVQEVVAGAPMHDCAHTMVVTNHEFTPAARMLAERHGCQLVAGGDIPRLRSIVRRLTTEIEAR